MQRDVTEELELTLVLQVLVMSPGSTLALDNDDATSSMVMAAWPEKAVSAACGGSAHGTRGGRARTLRMLALNVRAQRCTPDCADLTREIAGTLLDMTLTRSLHGATRDGEKGKDGG